MLFLTKVFLMTTKIRRDPHDTQSWKGVHTKINVAEWEKLHQISEEQGVTKAAIYRLGILLAEKNIKLLKLVSKEKLSPEILKRYG